MNEIIRVEEVKRHIQCCIDTDECILCSFFKEGCDKGTFAKIMLTAVQQLERERDAAIKDMYHAASDGGSFCDICKYNGEACEERKFNEMYCWEWRGAQEG